MKRAVITGIGVVSPLGNDTQTVKDSLYHCRSGIVYKEEYKEAGLRSLVAGTIKNLPAEELIDRKIRRFMGEAAIYTYISMAQAIEDAGLSEDQVSNIRTGIVAGSGGASSSNLVAAADILREKGLKRIGPYRVTKTMGSTVSACLASPFRIKGVNYSITSACATSAHCIGHAAELIQLGKQDIVFAGGGEEEHWSMTSLFDAMGALSTQFNAQPHRASRAFDVDRDGFVIAGGGGFLVVEELQHALDRGARIYAELTGYAATSDGFDMVAPSGEGGQRAMQLATSTARAPVDYINTHGTSTPVGDISEIKAIQSAFSDKVPHINSTKSLTGHSLGAAGVHEAIYTLLMLDNDFICESANIENLDPEFDDLPIVRSRIDQAGLQCAMSNSFGFGGTNAVLVFEKYNAQDSIG